MCLGCCYGGLGVGGGGGVVQKSQTMAILCTPDIHLWTFNVYTIRVSMVIVHLGYIRKKEKDTEKKKWRENTGKNK